MNINKFGRCVVVIALLAGVASSQEQIQSLTVNGGSNSIPVTQINGKNYVDVEALARATNGSLSFNGSNVILALPNGTATGTQTSATAPSAQTSSFSNAFLKAGVEAMSAIREWHSALASAIENNYPITSQGLASYQGSAATDLRLAQAAATTDDDKNLAQLLANGYQKMNVLSDRYLAQRKNMNYISPDSLANDPANQALIACGKSLAVVVASRQFTDDGSCH